MLIKFSVPEIGEKFNRREIFSSESIVHGPGLYVRRLWAVDSDEETKNRLDVFSVNAGLFENCG